MIGDPTTQARGIAPGPQLDREIGALRARIEACGDVDDPARLRLPLAELLVCRAFGVGPPLQTVYGLPAVMEIAGRLASGAGRADLDEAARELALATASPALRLDELMRAGRWLAMIQQFVTVTAAPEGPAPAEPPRPGPPEPTLSSLGRLFGLFAVDAPALMVDEAISMIVTAADPADDRGQPNDPVARTLAGTFRGIAPALRAAGAGESADLERLCAVTRGVGPGHPLHGMVLAVLGNRLAMHAEEAGDLAGMEVADECLAMAEAQLGDDWAAAGVPACALRVPRASGRVLRARIDRQRAAADRAIADLESELARLPSAHPWAPRALRVLGEAWRVRGELRGRADERREGNELIVGAGAALPSARPEVVRFAAAAALAQDEIATITGRRPARDAAIQDLALVAGRSGLTPVERAEVLLRLASSLRHRNADGDAADADLRVDQARAELAGHPDHPFATGTERLEG